MRLRILGSGTSFGVPQIGCPCAVCHSADPRDRRTRCSVYIESDQGARLLIDTPPELRLQLVDAGVTDIDAVLYTHEHADHLHGIDDLRAFTLHRREPLALYGSATTLRAINTRFSYVVDDSIRPLKGTSKPEGKLVEIAPGVPMVIHGTTVLPIAVPHGHATVMAFRVGDIGYVTDAKALPSAAREALAGVRVLILNALLRYEHPTHLSIAEAVQVAREIGAAQTYFTHLTHDNFHADLAAELPPGISPAYDGLEISLEPQS